MKGNRFFIKLNALRLILLLCLTAQTAFGQQETKPFSINESPLPAPTGFVNDYAGVIAAATEQKLERQLQSLKDTTKPPIEIAVAVVKTTGERPIFDYTLAVARGWKIGAKETDNPSALLLIAVDDRKYFTQVSKDLEDELPDGLVGQLQRQNLVPAFRQGDYSRGVSDTIDAYIKTISERSSGQTVAPPVAAEAENPRSGRRGGASIGSCSPCLVILIIILVFIFSRGGRGGGGGGFGRRNRWSGGGFGGSALPWIVGGMLGGMGNSGGGGSSSGWGGGGSSSDSGGFGGFGGGGDFGGGGGGGDW